MSSQSAQVKARRRGNSILLRLTSMQVFRNLAFAIKLDMLVFLLCAIAVFLVINDKAAKAYNALKEVPAAWEQIAEMPEMNAILEPPEPESIAGIPEMNIFPDSRTDSGIAVVEGMLGLGYRTGTAPVNNVIRYPDQLSSRLGLPGNTMMGFELNRWNPDEAMLVCEIIYPSYAEEYIYLSFDMSGTIRLFNIGFIILVSIELFLIITSIMGIRRSTKKTLNPIYELTAVAQIMNKASPKTARQELKLSGAIDTLNAINEDRLDTRISIDDEREELKGLAAAINAMLDRLDAAYQAQLRFVSDASHELRTPISVVQGYANLLDRWGKHDEKALQESIDAIKSEAQGMESLVEQLLFLARSDNNSIKTEPADIDVSLIAEEIVRETEMIDLKHGISGNISPQLMVHGDGQLIKQAIRIFVDNAIKYTPEEGRIKISAEQEGDKVRITVSDTGIGIAEKDIANVFDRFFRADESRARKTGGTGLGLAIAKWIIDHHGGYMEIVSRENIGTKISAVLPIKRVVVVDNPKIDEPTIRPDRPRAV